MVFETHSSLRRVCNGRSSHQDTECSGRPIFKMRCQGSCTESRASSRSLFRLFPRGRQSCRLPRPALPIAQFGCMLPRPPSISIRTPALRFPQARHPPAMHLCVHAVHQLYSPVLSSTQLHVRLSFVRQLRKPSRADTPVSSPLDPSL